MNNIGMLHEHGLGVPTDREEAISGLDAEAFEVSLRLLIICVSGFPIPD